MLLEVCLRLSAKSDPTELSITNGHQNLTKLDTVCDTGECDTPMSRTVAPVTRKSHIALNKLG